MDQPRVLARTLAKKAGLPATPEVGILATVIKKLRSQIESDLKITVSDGTLTTTTLWPYTETISLISVTMRASGI